jgi:hypothetical protein
MTQSHPVAALGRRSNTANSMATRMAPPSLDSPVSSAAGAANIPAGNAVSGFTQTAGEICGTGGDSVHGATTNSDLWDKGMTGPEAASKPPDDHKATPERRAEGHVPLGRATSPAAVPQAERPSIQVSFDLHLGSKEKQDCKRGGKPFDCVLDIFGDCYCHSGSQCMQHDVQWVAPSWICITPTLFHVCVHHKTSGM